MMRWILLAFWLAVVKLLHVRRARATIIALALVGPLVWVLGVPLHGVVLGILGGLVARHLKDGLKGRGELARKCREVIIKLIWLLLGKRCAKWQ